MKSPLAAIACALVFVACQPAADSFSEADRVMAEAEPVVMPAQQQTSQERVVTADEPDFVPEALAQSVLSQLGGWGAQGRDLTDALLHCSAVRVARLQPNLPQCRDGLGEEIDPACLVKRGVGRKSVGQALMADQADLNRDGTPDFILSDRYTCPTLSANQSAVYFVMLSQPDGKFGLSYAGWATQGLLVVAEPKTGAKVLVERSVKANGTFTRFLHLVGDRYVQRTCLFHDPRGFHACP